MVFSRSLNTRSQVTPGGVVFGDRVVEKPSQGSIRKRNLKPLLVPVASVTNCRLMDDRETKEILTIMGKYVALKRLKASCHS